MQNQADSVFLNASDFTLHLRDLRHERLAKKSDSLPSKEKRRSLTTTERAEILKKTNGHCHVCGGHIEQAWVADHVIAHVYAGPHDLENYLPAHAICNGARWFYGSEEFQWILKLGVFFRTQLEEIGDANAIRLAQQFVEYETQRNARRKNPLLPKHTS